jgi:DNA-directed RNA polymerase specialized sigma24 family protein
MTREQREQQEASSGEVVQELFQTAALILASQEEAVVAFEQAVARTDIDPSTEPAKVYLQTRELLTRLAVERAVALDPSAFTPEALAPASDVCLDTDDWEATGLTAGQLNELVSGTGRTRLRDWLEHLRPASRVIFVLRAILGKDSPQVAETLQQASPGAVWTPAQVGQVFRGALCSLATSLVHAPAVS